MERSIPYNRWEICYVRDLEWMPGFLLLTNYWTTVMNVCVVILICFVFCHPLAVFTTTTAWFESAAFLASVTPEIAKAFETKNLAISVYTYMLAISQLDMQILKIKWNKKLEILILSKQWKTVLKYITS